jgi:hypothetical protein
MAKRTETSKHIKKPDGRTKESRFAKTFKEELTSQLGLSASIARAHLIDRACDIALLIEVMKTKGPINALEYIEAQKLLMAIYDKLGITFDASQKTS